MKNICFASLLFISACGASRDHMASHSKGITDGTISLKYTLPFEGVKFGTDGEIQLCVGIATLKDTGVIFPAEDCGKAGKEIASKKTIQVTLEPVGSMVRIHWHKKTTIGTISVKGGELDKDAQVKELCSGAYNNVCDISYEKTSKKFSISHSM